MVLHCSSKATARATIPIVDDTFRSVKSGLVHKRNASGCWQTRHCKLPVQGSDGTKRVPQRIGGQLNITCFTECNCDCTQMRLPLPTNSVCRSRTLSSASLMH